MSENPAAAASATLAHSRSAAEGTEFIDLRESGGLERNQAGETRIVAGAGGHACHLRPARPAVLLRAGVMLLIASDSKNPTRTWNESGLVPLQVRAFVWLDTHLPPGNHIAIPRRYDGNGIATS